MRLCVVTGATNGIGFVTARELAKRGDKVIVVGRDKARVDETARTIGGEGAVADFSRLADVRALAASLPKNIDVLVNNAGLLCARREETADGFEMTFGVNHLAPFLLTNLLLGALNPNARIVNVASAVHKSGRLDFDDLHGKRSYNPGRAYSTSKLANILFTRELSRRLQNGITTNAVHPGAVASNFGHNNKGIVGFGFKVAQLFMIDADEGAKTSLHVANAPELAGVTGKYFVKSKETAPDKRALDDDVARKLWDVSANWVGLG